MSNRMLLALRLPLLFVLLLLLEAVNLVRLAEALSWTSPPPLNWGAALALGGFLVGSVVALSFRLEETLAGLKWAVGGLFFVQALLVSIVSYLYALQGMPAEQVAQLLGTPPELTRKVIAILESASINCGALCFWRVLGELWRQQLEEKARQRLDLSELESFLTEERR